MASSTTGTIFVNKTPNKPASHEDLFEPEVKLTDKEASTVIAQTVAALTGSAKLKVVDERKQRRDDFINSLPGDAQRALYRLRRLAGVDTFEGMFESYTPEIMNQMRADINKIDLTRVWKSYHEA